MALKTNCPVCESHQTSVFLVRENVPTRQNAVFKEQKAALEVPRGDIKLAVCGRCGFVFNAAFDDSLFIYGEHYDNAQFFSQAFDDYLSLLVDYLVDQRSVKNCRIVEVGCGDGYFLKRLVETGSNTGIGYDPSYVGPLEIMDGRVRFEQSYYGSEQADVSADVVICRHVIEHIAEPVALLKSIRQALSKSPSAYVFFETPTVDWILRNRTFWDVFYEHCSIFTAQSLITTFQQSGFHADEVKTAFGGQYLWMEASIPIVGAHSQIAYSPGEIPALAARFATSEDRFIKKWIERVESLHRTGPVALWGAGAKGVTFANLVDPENRHISCVVDVNPRKQGNFLPGTGHPIVDQTTLSTYGVKTVIVMNPNYRAEIFKSIKHLGLTVQLLDLNDETENLQ